MIDGNEKKLRYAVDRLDIACVAGDGVDAEVQKEAGVPHADLVIACTSADESNMLSCLKMCIRDRGCALPVRLRDCVTGVKRKRIWRSRYEDRQKRI